MHNSGAHLQRLAATGDRRGLLEAYDSLANIHIELGDPGFKHIVAGIYQEILVGDFPTADHGLYTRMGDFFASVGMETESATSYRKAGGKRQQGE